MSKKSLQQIAIERREWVNKEFGDRTRGKHMSIKEKQKLLNKLWKLAKAKIK